MRKALIVGVAHYDHFTPVNGCAIDAGNVARMFERHDDGSVNFSTPKLLLGTGTSPGTRVDRKALKEAARALFDGDSDIALFYFSGHGYIEDTGGYLCGTDGETGDDGFSLADLMEFANKSPAKHRIIVLDCCHSGVAGERSNQVVAEIKEGTTILTASTATEGAIGFDTRASVFTALFLDALGGAAANLLGDVTPGSVYAHIDQSLGPWAQRPMFKTNVKAFVSLRKAEAPIRLTDLQALVTHFPQPEYEFRLDPTYEPERSPEQRADPNIPPPDPSKNAVFAGLQMCARVNLVRPVGAPHMWHAAMHSKSCTLTVLGRHYWRLVKDGLI